MRPSTFVLSRRTAGGDDPAPFDFPIRAIWNNLRAGSERVQLLDEPVVRWDAWAAAYGELALFCQLSRTLAAGLPVDRLPGDLELVGERRDIIVAWIQHAADHAFVLALNNCHAGLFEAGRLVAELAEFVGVEL